jgi:hypothetical protein
MHLFSLFYHMCTHPIFSLPYACFLPSACATSKYLSPPSHMRIHFLISHTSSLAHMFSLALAHYSLFYRAHSFMHLLTHVHGIFHSHSLSHMPYLPILSLMHPLVLFLGSAPNSLYIGELSSLLRVRFMQQHTYIHTLSLSHSHSSIV